MTLLQIVSYIFVTPMPYTVVIFFLSSMSHTDQRLFIFLWTENRVSFAFSFSISLETCGDLLVPEISVLVFSVMHCLQVFHNKLADIRHRWIWSQLRFIPSEEPDRIFSHYPVGTFREQCLKLQLKKKHVKWFAYWVIFLYSWSRFFVETPSVLCVKKTELLNYYINVYCPDNFWY